MLKLMALQHNIVHIHNCNDYSSKYVIQMALLATAPKGIKLGGVVIVFVHIILRPATKVRDPEAMHINCLVFALNAERRLDTLEVLNSN